MGMSMRIEGDGLKAFRMRLDRFQQHVEDATPMMVSLAAEYEQKAKTGFGTSSRPSGSRWAALSPQYKRWKKVHFPGAPILTRTGTLGASLGPGRGAGAVREIGKTHMRYGTRVVYARYHQHGTNRMPSRPILPSKTGMSTRTSQIMHQFMFDGVA